MLYLLYKVAKDTPPMIIKISVGVFFVALVAIELWQRHLGSVPYFTIACGHESSITEIVCADCIEDYRVMICDSFGVNKLNRNAKYHTENILNNDGFRSHYGFTQQAIDSVHKHNKKAILFIGDSYTYGLSADSGYSFADRLENKGAFAVFNAGIPGTDLPQYSAIVKEYIASGLIHPDKIVVCINSANDLNHFPDRALTPNIPILYYTNVGGIYAFQGGDRSFKTAKEAYKNILEQYTIVGILGEGLLSKIIGKSIVASRLVGLFRKKEEVKATNNINTTAESKIDPAFQHIATIKASCDAMGIPVLFVLLPGKEFVRKQKALSLDGVVSLNPTIYTLNDYTEKEDDHPNNIGHQKMAKQLYQLVMEDVSTNPKK